MSKLSALQMLAYLKSYLCVYDQSSQKTYISSTKSNENPNFLHEIGKSHTNQLIGEIIHDKYKVLLKDSEVKNLNGLIKFYCIKNDKYKHIHTRVCCQNNSIYFDMGDGTIRKITDSKHDLIEKSPVKFLNSISTGAIVEPDIANADIELLHNHIHISDSTFKVLLVAILNAFFTDTAKCQPTCRILLV